VSDFYYTLMNICILLLVVGSCLLLISIALAIITAKTYPIGHGNASCVYGSFINEKGQMWCSPNELTKVDVDYSPNIKIYREKKDKLPAVTYRNFDYSNSYPSVESVYKYYCFEAMAGSSIIGEISSTNSDNCYLMDSSQFYGFQNYYNDQYYILSFIKKGVKTLNLNYTFTKSDGYYLVIDHPSKDKADLFFNVSISFAVYDMSSFTPVTCANFKCSFDDVNTTDIIIADNTGQSDANVTMIVPGTLNTAATVVLIVFTVLTFIPGAIMFFVFLFFCIYMAYEMSKE